MLRTDINKYTSEDEDFNKLKKKKQMKKKIVWSTFLFGACPVMSKKCKMGQNLVVYLK